MERKVLLVWNQFEEGNLYFLFNEDSAMARLCKAFHGHYVNYVNGDGWDDHPDFDQFSIDLLGPDDNQYPNKVDPLTIDFTKVHIVAIYESGFIP